MGINSSLWVISPSILHYDKIISELSIPETKALVSSQFNWPEMQFATLFWSGEWTSVDLRFSSFNGYPSLGLLWNTFRWIQTLEFQRKGNHLSFWSIP